jgi:hypothetical protein
MSEAAPDLDFSRYAPERPRLVWENPDHQPPDDLAQALYAIRAGLQLVAHLILIAARIACRRALSWCRARLDDLLGSLAAAWSIAGIGWGFGLGVSLIHYFAR